jgi:predicted thioesterase
MAVVRVHPDGGERKAYDVVLSEAGLDSVCSASQVDFRKPVAAGSTLYVVGELQEVVGRKVRRGAH